MLLTIFCNFLDDSPRHWPTLVHICRKWRRIVFTYRLALQLRLFCTHRTPVLESLDCWPAALPIVVEYGGSPELDPPALEDENNIIAALKRSDRVTSISLTVTNTLLEKLSALRVKRSFSKLEDLVLLSPDSLPYTLIKTFRSSPRLRRLHLTRIVVPALFQPRYSSRNLVDLRLHDVSYPHLISPRILLEALSWMGQLRSLSFHFPPTVTYHTSPASSDQLVLPALTRLDFRGIPEYLGDFMASIHAPHLEDFEVTLFDIFAPDLFSISRLFSRLEVNKSHRRVHISSSERAISMSLLKLKSPTLIKLQILCERFGKQLSILSQICKHLLALLSDVEDLRISVTGQLRRENSHEQLSTKWLDPIASFTNVKWLHLDGNPGNSVNIIRALQESNREHEIVTVLPALLKLYISQPGPRYAPLRDVVVSLMTSRWLFGRPIVVEYIQLRHISEPHGAGTLLPTTAPLLSNSFEVGPFSQQVTFESLSDDVLLNIFYHNLDVDPRFWPTLACVCRSWRRIVLTSPLGLNLRLYCTHGTPVLKALDCWRALPIVMLYGGVPGLDPPAPEDDDNIIAALKQSDRVSSISLTTTSSLLEKLTAVSEPLSELESLTLLSQNNVHLTLPTTFRWGARLRALHSTRIAFPSFPQLLLPSRDVVDLQLHEIPTAGYFSPEALANALLGMTSLETLSLHFLSHPSRRIYLAIPPPPGERAVLSALTYLKYRGTSKYLDSLVARIEAPHLGDIDITLSFQPTMDVSQLGRFIERIEMKMELIQADIETFAHAISISFTNSSIATPPLRLQISCTQSDWQSSCMAQVCVQFSPFLFHVRNLAINMPQVSRGQDDLDGEQWLQLVLAFGGAEGICMTSDLARSILRALPTDGRNATVLLALRHLHVQNFMAVNGPLWNDLQSLRRLSAHSDVELHPSCHICAANLTQLKSLKAHLVSEHAYQVVQGDICSYCGDFECQSGHRDLFREHLKSKHPEITCNDELISQPFLTPSQFGHLVKRHTTACTGTCIVAPSTMPPPMMPQRHSSLYSDPETGFDTGFNTVSVSAPVQTPVPTPVPIPAYHGQLSPGSGEG